MSEKKRYSERAEPLQLNLTEILRSRITGAKGKLIPSPLLKSLEKLIHQDDLNYLLQRTFPTDGSEFARRLMKEMNITIHVRGLDELPEGERFIFAGNHPLGGLDGIALIGVLGEKYGDDNVRFLVNDMLMNVEPLQSVFLPINKYGSQGREAAKTISEAYKSDMQMAIFPAGLVSRLGPEGIRDLRWHKAFASKALETNRRIVPVRFGGENTSRFYKTSKWRKKLGVKVNIEQALLPGEFCKARGKEFTITFGKPVDPKPLREAGMTPQQIADEIRRMVYELPFD